MPRGPRIDVAEALYHVIARGVERRAIVRSDRDREDFVDRVARLVGEAAETAGGPPARYGSRGGGECGAAGADSPGGAGARDSPRGDQSLSGHFDGGGGATPARLRRGCLAT